MRIAALDISVAKLYESHMDALAILAELDRPMLAELGFAGFDVRDWQGFAVPSKTPKPLIERLAAAITDALEQPEVKGRLAGIGAEPVADSNPEAFGALVQSELARWAKVVRDAGIRAE